MIPGSITRVGWLAALLSTAAPSHAAATWSTDPVRSRLEFTATLAGGDFDGSFERFQADIVFDPADLPHSRFRVEIDTASADTGDKDRDDALAGGDFFAVERWPRARFQADRFSSLGGGRFEALGSLTIRDVTREIRLPFSFRPSSDGARAEMTGGTTIHRLDYGVGQGEWRDTKWVGDEVQIRFALMLHRK
jgi:polyisoprenoid-binding protein YceI